VYLSELFSLFCSSHVHKHKHVHILYTHTHIYIYIYIYIHTYVYATYSFFILCFAFRVASMQNKFHQSYQQQIEGRAGTVYSVSQTDYFSSLTLLPSCNMYVSFSLSGDDSVCAEHGTVNCDGHTVTALSKGKSQ
jgi:hypothetical protein